MELMLSLKKRKIRTKDEMKARMLKLEASTNTLFLRTRILSFLHLLNGMLAILTYFGYPIPMLLINGIIQIGCGMYFLVKR